MERIGGGRAPSSRRMQIDSSNLGACIQIGLPAVLYLKRADLDKYMLIERGWRSHRSETKLCDRGGGGGNGSSVGDFEHV